MPESKENPAQSSRRSSWENPPLTAKFFPHTLAFSEQIYASHIRPEARDALEQNIIRELTVVGSLVQMGFKHGIFDAARKPLLHEALMQGLNLDRLYHDRYGRASQVTDAFKASSSREFLEHCDMHMNPFVRMAHNFGYPPTKLWSAYGDPVPDRGNKWHGVFAQIVETLASDLKMVPPEDIQRLFRNADSRGQARVLAGLVQDLVEVNLSIILAHRLGMVSNNERLSMLSNPNYAERQRESESLGWLFRSLIRSWNEAEDLGLLTADQRKATEKAVWARKDIISINHELENLEGRVEIRAGLARPNLDFDGQAISENLRDLAERLEIIAQHTHARPAA